MSAHGTRVLLAPLGGWASSLGEVPDEAFALLGGGVAIDPTAGTLHAPCDGVVKLLPASRHAVTLQAGAHEILLHVGIDTVALAGEGFTAHVATGEPVRAGQLLLSFDLDLLAQRARSLITPVLVLDGRDLITRCILDREVQVGDFLMEIAAPADAGAPGPSASEEAICRELWLPLPHGLHARPAARLVQALQPFSAQVSVCAHGREASARSATSLMALGASHGDVLTVRASGADAAAAVAAIEAALRQAAAAEQANPAAATPRTVERFKTGTQSRSQAENGPIRGIPASPGIALGTAVQLHAGAAELPEKGQGVEHERAQLAQAIAQAHAQLGVTSERGSGPACEIAAAHQQLLADPELEAAAQALILAGKSAAFAWRQATHAQAAVLAALSDPHLAARADDLRDLDSQVQAHLAQATAPITMPAGSIVLARDLLPSQMTQLEAAGICGICLASGGPTSHLAILAQAAGIPALVAAGPQVLEVPAGELLVLDAEGGTLEIAPRAERVSEVRKLLAERRAAAAAAQAAAAAPGRTADGRRIEVLANVGSVADACAAAAAGAEGCGLLRTELLFLDRRTPPSAAEQTAAYQAIASALAGRPVTIRTLDIGGDKPIPYLPLPPEDNPALGMRGVRTSLWQPGLLSQQCAAILAVQPAGQCRILLPMITEVAELHAVHAVLDEARAATGYNEPIPVGVMIETPAAALLAGQLAQQADFFSIGTNDLTQYTLAMDRGHPELAARTDALHPAVLRLIAQVADAGRASNTPVAVCGALASDPEAVPILVGLGVQELSVVPAFIPRLKALLAMLTLPQCVSLAQEALNATSAQQVRELSARALARLATAAALPSATCGHHGLKPQLPTP